MQGQISLLIPVYNLSKTIVRDFKKAYNKLMELGINFEIIIVDDNSTDRYQRIKRLIDSIKFPAGKEIRYMRFDHGPSHRENLAKSFYLAKNDIIGFIDGDFSCDIIYFIKAVNVLKARAADIVIGSRYIKGAKVKRRVARRIISFFYNLFIRLFFNSKIKDHQCGLKVFRKSTVMPIIDIMGYDAKFIRGWFWDAELLIRAQKLGLKIIEMPVEWVYADKSTFDIKKELRCIQSIIKLKIEFIRSLSSRK